LTGGPTGNATISPIGGDYRHYRLTFPTEKTGNNIIEYIGTSAAMKFDLTLTKP